MCEITQNPAQILLLLDNVDEIPLNQDYLTVKGVLGGRDWKFLLFVAGGELQSTKSFGLTTANFTVGKHGHLKSNKISPK